MATTLTESDLTGTDLVVLLTIEFAGAKWRFSSRPVEVLDADGESYAYLGGLEDLELTDEMDLFSDTPATRSVPIAVIWPSDVAELVALGHDLGAATGELALWVDGTTYEERLVFLDGYVSDPEYGEPEEAVSFSLEENPWDDTNSVLDDSAVCKDGVTWDGVPDGNEGVLYPLVFGSPGPYTLTDGTAKDSSGSPATVVDGPGVPYYLIIAGHRTVAGETGATVQVYSTEYDEWASCTAVHVEDNQGRMCTMVDGFDGYFGSLRDTDGDGATEPWHSDDSFWVSWTGGAGAYSLSANAGIEGAGDLLEFMLNRTSLRIDRGRVAAAKDYLNQIKVSGYVDEQGSAYDWIKDTLLPLLPVSMTSGPDGIYPVVYRWDATAKDAVAELIEGPEHGLVREGPIAYEGRDSLINEMVISYALRARTGEYHRTRIISGDPEYVGLTDYLTSTHARQSHLRYGRKATSFSSDILYDTNSADIICLWKVLAHGFVRRVVTFSADQKWGWLNKGDIVTVTLDRLHIRGQIGIVRSKQWSLSGFIKLEVVLLEDPVRDLRLGQV